MWSTSLGVPLSLSVPIDYSVSDVEAAGLELSAGPPLAAFISITRYRGEVFAEGNGHMRTRRLPETAAALLEFLAGHSDLQVKAVPTRIRVDGHAGFAIDIQVPLGAGLESPPGWVWLWPQPLVGDFHLTQGESARIIAIDTAGAVLVIVIEAFPGTDLDAYLDQVAPIIESIRIGGREPG